MTSANHLRFAKIVGKLAYMYDTAGASVATLQDIQYGMMEEFTNSTDRDANLPEVQILAASFAQITSAITNGPTALQAVIVALAKKIFTDDDFVGTLTTVPANSSIGAVLTAWATEMTSVDNVTFTTLGSTGIVHFLNTVGSATFSWHTSGSPTYHDGTYAVASEV